jgi:hypothetical protein
MILFGIFSSFVEINLPRKTSFEFKKKKNRLIS